MIRVVCHGNFQFSRKNTVMLELRSHLVKNWQISRESDAVRAVVTSNYNTTARKILDILLSPVRAHSSGKHFSGIREALFVFKAQLAAVTGHPKRLFKCK